MNCPCCGRAMEKGLLQGSGNILSWVKKIHRLSLLPGTGEVMLARKYFPSASVDAYICRRCKKVVADYSASNYEEG